MAQLQQKTTARLRRRQTDLQRKRNDILVVAEKIFAERGFHHARMEEIARACGYAVGALYKYFPSKDEIYSRLIHAKLDLLFELVHREVENTAEFEPFVRGSIRGCVQFFEGNRDFFRIYVNEAKGFQWGLKQSIGATVFSRFQEFHSLLAAAFERCQNRGELRGDVQPMSMAVALVGVINSFFSQWVTQDEKSDWQLHADEIAEVVLHGIRRQTGRPASRAGARK